jgi:hypothetical protein
MLEIFFFPPRVVKILPENILCTHIYNNKLSLGLIARRVAECFQRRKCFKDPYKRVSYAIFYYTCTTI